MKGTKNILMIDQDYGEALNLVDSIVEDVENRYKQIAEVVQPILDTMPGDITRLSDEELIRIRSQLLRFEDYVSYEMSRIDTYLTRAKEKRNLMEVALIEAQRKEGVSKAEAKENLMRFKEYRQLHLEVLRNDMLKKRLEALRKRLSSWGQLLSREQSRRSDEVRKPRFD